MSAFDQLHRLTALKRDVNWAVKNYGYTSHIAEGWQTWMERVVQASALWEPHLVHPSLTITALPMPCFTTPAETQSDQTPGKLLFGLLSPGHFGVSEDTLSSPSQLLEAWEAKNIPHKSHSIRNRAYNSWTVWQYLQLHKNSNFFLLLLSFA